MHFNRQFYFFHPYIYQIIQIIMGIQGDIDLKINSIKIKIMKILVEKRY